MSKLDRWFERLPAARERFAGNVTGQKGRCPIRSSATGRRCTLARHHTTSHERRSRSGRLLEEWARTADDTDHVATCTSAELIAHLNDLIDLAKWEGYGAIVGALERAKREITGFTYSRPRRGRRRPPSLFGGDRER